MLQSIDPWIKALATNSLLNLLTLIACFKQTFDKTLHVKPIEIQLGRIRQSTRLISCFYLSKNPASMAHNTFPFKCDFSSEVPQDSVLDRCFSIFYSNDLPPYLHDCHFSFLLITFRFLVAFLISTSFQFEMIEISLVILSAFLLMNFVNSVGKFWRWMVRKMARIMFLFSRARKSPVLKLQKLRIFSWW